MLSESRRSQVILSLALPSMDTEEFREHGKAMVEYMCEYMESLPERRVTPSVEPGYLRKLLPPEAPVKPESWDTIMADVNSKIMPGVSDCSAS